MTATDKQHLWDSWAARYDGYYGPMDARAAADHLSRLPAQRYLELNVRTGRVALELASRGAEVIGLDISPEMIALLEEKARSMNVNVEASVGDMTDFEMSDRVDCVYMAYSSLYELETTEVQLRCFTGV